MPAGYALGMEDRLAGGTRRPRRIEAVVLVDGHLQPGGHVAAPPVVTGDAVRICGADVTEQVGANQVAAVVRLAESRQFAIAQLHRLHFRKEHFAWAPFPSPAAAVQP